MWYPSSLEVWASGCPRDTLKYSSGLLINEDKFLCSYSKIELVFSLIFWQALFVNNKKKKNEINRNLYIFNVNN